MDGLSDSGAGGGGDGGAGGEVPGVAADDDGSVELAVSDPGEIGCCGTDHAEPQYSLDQSGEDVEADLVLVGCVCADGEVAETNDGAAQAMDVGDVDGFAVTVGAGRGRGPVAVAESWEVDDAKGRFVFFDQGK